MEALLESLLLMCFSAAVVVLILQGCSCRLRPWQLVILHINLAYMSAALLANGPNHGEGTRALSVSPLCVYVVLMYKCL